MALVSSYTSTANNLLGQTRSIKSSLQATRKSFTNINKVFATRTRIRSTIFKQRQVTNQRKLEALSRREQTDAMQAAKFSITSRGPGLRLAQTGKSFLGRILDFIASLSIGWILSNLPTWISYAKAFVKRVLALKDSIFGFVQAAFSFVGTFGNTLSGVLADIASFNFSQIPTTVDNGIKELEKSIDDMSTEFEKGFSLFSQPLFDESELEQPAQQTAQEMSGVDVPPGTPYTGPSYESTGGRKITRSEFGRGFRVRDNLGSGRTAFGHTGIDVGMPTGTPLSIVPPGVVVEANAGYNGGYGYFVCIKLDDGRFVKINHLSKILVREGERVGAGSGPNGGVKVIGLVGSTGLSTGPHMHIDLGSGYNRGPAQLTGLTDPAGFILGGGVVKGGNVKSTGATTTTTTPATTLSGAPQRSGAPQSQISSGPVPKSDSEAFEKVRAAAQKAGSPAPDITAAIAMVETGWLRNPNSVYFASGKTNPFGQTVPAGSTGQYVIGADRQKHAVYKSFDEGVAAHVRLWKKYYKGRTADEILRSLVAAGYNTASPGWRPNIAAIYERMTKKSRGAPVSGTGTLGPSPSGAPEITTMQQQNVPGSITPSREGEVIIAQFPSSGVSVPPGMQGYADSGSSSASPAPMPTKSESELLNTFIKNRLLVELSYL